ncbi:MAG: ABC transporter permease subunit [Pseudomonadota bacterium]
MDNNFVRWRHFKDKAAKHLVGIGGLAVLVALTLIFVYLLTEVLPLFKAAHITPRTQITGTAPALFLSSEEQGEIGMRSLPDGALVFSNLHTGELRKKVQLPLGANTVSSVAEINTDQAYYAAGLSDGSVLPYKTTYTVTYPDDKRHIEPDITYPYGDKALPFMPEASRVLAVRDERGTLLMVGVDAVGAVHLKAFEVQTSLLGETHMQETGVSRFTPPLKADFLLIDPLQSWLYVADAAAGKLVLYALKGAAEPRLVDTADIGGKVLAAEFLGGGISVITADSRGKIVQWFPARREAKGPKRLTRVREFEISGGTITAITAEPHRRVFAVADDRGIVTLFHATAQSKILETQVAETPIHSLAFNPRAHTLLSQLQDGHVQVLDVENDHPEVSFSSLWGKVWYESYDEPKYLWQSSAANADFEPKFSLTPLTLGTLKGAFYAMLFAVPIAILGAIFTANFMSPAMRQIVKPTVEIMQALPTVILGFLAGLWLAPFVESNLPGVFLLLFLLPMSLPLFGYVWMRAPAKLRLMIPPGWEAALLIPSILLVTWLCFALASPIELAFFGGNMQGWMDRSFGIGYEQRNCLVVGIAMGIAVIPSIFSITEDAIFSVPKQLTLGSLALGATQWQTLMGVVLPTASPGIFSAVMIGLGRAVGETMIVLMATGNTPVTDFSLFSGMRTLSANVAVEMPESEVGSTHFRILFLAGLVLFLLTFTFNTLAEVVRQRLREKYSNI